MLSEEKRKEIKNKALQRSWMSMNAIMDMLISDTIIAEQQEVVDKFKEDDDDQSK